MFNVVAKLCKLSVAAKIRLLTLVQLKKCFRSCQPGGSVWHVVHWRAITHQTTKVVIDIHPSACFKADAIAASSPSTMRHRLHQKLCNVQCLLQCWIAQGRPMVSRQVLVGFKCALSLFFLLSRCSEWYIYTGSEGSRREDLVLLYMYCSRRNDEIMMDP